MSLRRFILAFTVLFCQLAVAQTYELPCPNPGQLVISRTFDSLTGKYRAYVCSDSSGNVTLNPNAITGPAISLSDTTSANQGLFFNGSSGWNLAGTDGTSVQDDGIGDISVFGGTGGGIVLAPSATKAVTVNTGIVISGTKFTASGCSNSTTVGGATAGSFASGTTGTCTVVITFGGGLTGSHGWSCWANDLTTTADKINQINPISTTQATLTGTTTSGDIINFGCMGY